MKKMVTLVDQNDKVIGSADIYQAHRHPTQLHRAISVFLVRDKNGVRQTLLQKRSLEKIVGAGQWSNGVCANVFPDESYIECAQRRLKEEIGVEGVDLKPLYKFTYQVYSNAEYGEHEIDQVYIARFDGETNNNPAEVSDSVWISVADLDLALQNKKLITSKETLEKPTGDLKNLTPPLHVQIDQVKYEITPWMAVLLADRRLRSALRDF